jgi:hypothetical protein
MNGRPHHLTRGTTTLQLVVALVALIAATLAVARPLMGLRDAQAADADIEITVTATREPPDPYIVPPPAGFVGLMAANPVRQPVDPDPAYGTSLALDSNAMELINRGIILGPRAPGCYRTVVSKEIRVPVELGSALATFLQEQLQARGIDQPIGAEGVVVARHTLAVEWRTDGTNVIAGASFPRVETAPAAQILNVSFAGPSNFTGAGTLPQPTLTSESTANFAATPIPGITNIGAQGASTITIRDSAALTDFAPNVNAPEPAHGAVASRPC